MPKGGYRAGGSGNARWKAAVIAGRFQKGNPHLKRCTAVKRNGERCKAVAIRNWHRCFAHGGAFVLMRRGLYISRRVRHGNWTERESTQRRSS
jgi:hypothetical protein